ncbi:MAG: prolipoprotein diacylglyceryl transferase [Candidatus Omnitrophota bacterium]
MHPIICTIGPFTLYSYGLMLAIAFLAGSRLACIQAKKEKICPDAVFNLLFIAFFSGIIGARIFYIAGHLADYLADPKEIFMLQHGGLSWFGGLLFGIIAAVYYLKKHALAKYKILDLIAPFIALGQAIGRLGCFLNGCCFSKAGVAIQAQIVSSFLLLAIFVFLRFLQDRPYKPGQVFFSYLLLYSIKRFFVELLRGDNPPFVWSLTLFQLFSIALFLISAWRLIRINRAK